MTVDPEILGHYGRGAELGRLESGASAIEFARTKELLERYLPPPPARVLDVGGGPGVYALWLAELGYDVHLIDPLPLHVKHATELAAGRFEATVGDARRLEAEAASADAVLLLGPLYHLTERSDRIQALSEACRVLRPGGLIAAAAISRFASMFDGLFRRYVTDPDFRLVTERDLVDGQHRSPAGRDAYFTTAYFHHPSELEGELWDAAVECEGVYGIEGPAWLEPGLWEEDELREASLWAARTVESEPTLLGLSAHLLAVGRRP
ncbi:MAG: class I SAM-dependent methyltransferase [Gaiellaceae bacterium]